MIEAFAFGKRRGCELSRRTVITQTLQERDRIMTGREGQLTRIYTVFTSAGLSGSSQTYSLHHPDKRVLSNQDMLSEIRRRCEGVEFVGAAEVEKSQYVFAKVEAQRRNLDGLLYFGSLPDAFMQLDLPTVAVYPLWGQWQEPFHPYRGNRVLTATLVLSRNSSVPVNRL